MPKRWEQYKGKSWITCNGRCVCARNLSVFYLTLLLVVVFSGLFFAFDCRFLAVNLSPAVPVFAVLQCGFVLACLLRTTLSDPGIIPRAGPDEAAWMEAEMASHSTVPQYETLRDIRINGRLFKLKFCQTCKLWRPPRASHCSTCDNCVDRFDHHCPWVGNCVGRRNYRYFYLFLASVTVYCVYIMVFGCINLVILSRQKNGDFIQVLRESPTRYPLSKNTFKPSFTIFDIFKQQLKCLFSLTQLNLPVCTLVVILVAFFSLFSVVGLGGFHTLLICRETSTNEDIKDLYNTKRNPDLINPFDHGGGCANFCYILFGPTAPVNGIGGVGRGGGNDDLAMATVSSSASSLSANRNRKPSGYGGRKVRLAAVGVAATLGGCADLPGAATRRAGRGAGGISGGRENAAQGDDTSLPGSSHLHGFCLPPAHYPECIWTRMTSDTALIIEAVLESSLEGELERSSGPGRRRSSRRSLRGVERDATVEGPSGGRSGCGSGGGGSGRVSSRRRRTRRRLRQRRLVVVMMVVKVLDEAAAAAAAAAAVEAHPAVLVGAVPGGGVGVQLLPGVEAHVTGVAAVRLVLGVLALVALQVAHLGETFGAVPAAVGLVARVNSFVLLHVRQLGEPLVAVLAAVRPLSGVNAAVLAQ
uniref:Palmitoyltransferase n=1 Tax=Macrostomum lignano TaxID=282301 RepID=A0A1I8IU25_9PLAT